MNRLSLQAAAAALLLGLAVPAQAASGDITGLWATSSADGRVLIESCGRALCGTVVDGAPLRANPDQRDVRNPDPGLRHRRVLGLTVLKDFTGGPRRWKGGPVYDPVTGEGARWGTLTLRRDGRLEVKGCVLFVCRTKLWTRVEPETLKNAGL